jgi:hypothetical protein
MEPVERTGGPPATGGTRIAPDEPLRALKEIARVSRQLKARHVAWSISKVSASDTPDIRRCVNRAETRRRRDGPAGLTRVFDRLDLPRVRPVSKGVEGIPLR